MRRLWILTVTLCLLPVFGMQAQEYTQTPVTISKEKVRGSDGNVYYSHVVLDKQTLFSISKAYGVTIEEIYDANPAANLRTEGLKKNAIILIPVQSSAPQAVATPAAAAPHSFKIRMSSVLSAMHRESYSAAPDDTSRSTSCRRAFSASACPGSASRRAVSNPIALYAASACAASLAIDAG